MTSPEPTSALHCGHSLTQGGHGYTNTFIVFASCDGSTSEKVSSQLRKGESKAETQFQSPHVSHVTRRHSFPGQRWEATGTSEDWGTLRLWREDSSTFSAPDNQCPLALDLSVYCLLLISLSFLSFSLVQYYETGYLSVQAAITNYGGLHSIPA